ncbi:MAG: hypothetical protein ACR2OR_02155 [Hyphomicrobiales bacterium]
MSEPSTRFGWPFLLKLTFLVLIVIAANMATGWITDALNFKITPQNEVMVHTTILAAAGAYALLLAVPFVPGVEIAFALIGMFGPPVVLLVYGCTLVGLSISFFVGRMLSVRRLTKLVEDLGLSRLGELLRTLQPMSRHERVAFLVEKAPNRFVPFLLKHRYIALAVALNLPGNFLIGGGGGIALVAGLSRLYSTGGFLATVAIAASPIPIAVLLFGKPVL